LLEKRYKREEHRSKIARIPVIMINDQVTIWAIVKPREWRIVIHSLWCWSRFLSSSSPVLCMILNFLILFQLHLNIYCTQVIDTCKYWWCIAAVTIIHCMFVWLLQ
jgi:hypothetical protein